MTFTIHSRLITRYIIAIISSLSLVSFADELRIKGFLSQGYLESSHYNYLADTEDGDSDFSEFAINASWTPLDRTTVNGQIFAFELGPYGNYEPILDYLFLDYSPRKEFGIRLGRIKRELGIYNHIQDIDVSRTAILLPMGMYDQRYRDSSASLDGVSTYGTLKLAQGHSIDFNIYCGLYNLENDGGIAGFALSEISKTSINARVEGITTDYNAGFQFWYNPALEGLRLGVGLSYYPNVTLNTASEFPDQFPIPQLAGQTYRSFNSDIDSQATRLSAEYFIGNWNFAAEFNRNKINRDVYSTIGGNPLFSGRGYRGYDAWYTSIARRFGPLETALTYSDYQDTSTPLPGTPPIIPDSNYNRDLQISFRYDVTDYWTLKLENHSIRGTSRLFNQYLQNPVLDKSTWSLWSVKSTFYF